MPSQFQVPFGNTANIRVQDAIGNFWMWKIPMLHTIDIQIEPIQLSTASKEAIEESERTLVMIGQLKKRPTMLQAKYAAIWRAKTKASLIKAKNQAQSKLRVAIWKRFVVQTKTIKHNVVSILKQNMERRTFIRNKYVLIWKQKVNRSIRMRKCISMLRGKIYFQKFKQQCINRRTKRYHEFVATHWKWNYYGSELMTSSFQFRISYHILCNMRALFDRVSKGQYRGLVRDALETVQARSSVLSLAQLTCFQDKILLDVDRFIRSKPNFSEDETVLGIMIPCLLISPFMMMHSAIRELQSFFGKFYSTNHTIESWINNLVSRKERLPSVVVGMLIRSIQLPANNFISKRMDMNFPKYDEFYRMDRCPVKVCKYKPGDWMSKYMVSIINYSKPSSVIFDDERKSKLKQMIQSKANQRKSKKV